MRLLLVALALAGLNDEGLGLCVCLCVSIDYYRYYLLNLRWGLLSHRFLYYLICIVNILFLGFELMSV